MPRTVLTIGEIVFLQFNFSPFEFLIHKFISGPTFTKGFHLWQDSKNLRSFIAQTHGYLLGFKSIKTLIEGLQKI